MNDTGDSYGPMNEEDVAKWRELGVYGPLAGVDMSSVDPNSEWGQMVATNHPSTSGGDGGSGGAYDPMRNDVSLLGVPDEYKGYFTNAGVDPNHYGTVYKQGADGSAKASQFYERNGTFWGGVRDLAKFAATAYAMYAGVSAMGGAAGAGSGAAAADSAAASDAAAAGSAEAGAGAGASAGTSTAAGTEAGASTTGSTGAAAGGGGSSSSGLGSMWSAGKAAYGTYSGVKGMSNMPTGTTGASDSLAALYDFYAKNQRAKELGSTVDSLKNMYSAGSPEAEDMRRRIEARDAAAGRRSQYGPREAELQANLAHARMQVLSSPGYMNLQAAHLANAPRTGGLSGLVAAYGNGKFDKLGNTAVGTYRDLADWYARNYGSGGGMGAGLDTSSFTNSPEYNSYYDNTPSYLTDEDSANLFSDQ